MNYLSFQKIVSSKLFLTGGFIAVYVLAVIVGVTAGMKVGESAYRSKSIGIDRDQRQRMIFLQEQILEQLREQTSLLVELQSMPIDEQHD